jgi:Periplasmic copper-binding protein (NosD)
MRKLILYACLLGAIAITMFSCSKDKTESSESAPEPVNEQQVRQYIQNALKQIQTVQNVDMSIQTRMSSQFIVVPAGSNNALAQALTDAGEGGIVYLRTGLHTETAGIVIRSKVTVVGENGAILKIKSVASVMNLANGVTQINPAIHVLNAPQTSILNVEIQPIDSDGSTAILFENAPLSASMFCTFKRFMFSVLVEKSNQMTIMGNKITASTLWQANPGPIIGVLISNGKSAWIANNEVEAAFVGIFTSDQYGSVVQNNTHNNYTGIVLCGIAPNSLKLPDGHLTGGELKSNNWKVNGNKSDNNITSGYWVIDGSNNNTLENNTSTGNGAYDIELIGQTSRVGFPMSPCFNNTVRANAGQKVKDCGNNNTVSGGIMVSDGCSDPYPNDVAVAWVQLFQKLTSTTAGTNVVRIAGYVGVCMYEALLPSLTGYKSLAQQIGLSGLPTPQSGATYHGAASVNAAMAQTLRNFFPTTSAANKTEIDLLESAWNTKFAIETNTSGLQRSTDFGKQVASVIFEWSKTDGNLNVNPPYVLPVGSGFWVPTPPAFVPIPVNPYGGNNRTFISGLVNSIPITPPPVTYSTDPNSDYYKTVKELYDASQNLTTEQTTIAKTWADFGSFYSTPGAHYINIVTQLIVNNHLALDDAAVLYAKTGIAASDGVTFVFKIKYQYTTMRPITYIRSVMGQPTWNAVVPTPPHPEYPSAHVFNGQPIMEVLKARFGNNITFVDRTNEALYGARTYTNFDAIVQEASISRFYAGIHYKNTAAVSIPMGVEVGKLVNRLKFKD